MPTNPASDGSSSVCTKPEFAPIHYHWYRLQSNEGVIAAVRRLAVDAGLRADDVDRVVGEVRARLRLLVRGRLVPIEHVKGPMETVTDVDVFEVRANVEVFGGRTFAVRLYHTEPRRLRRKPGSTIVGVHVHAKDLTDSRAVWGRQNAQLQQARKRIHDGRAARWGGAALLPIEFLER